MTQAGGSLNGWSCRSCCELDRDMRRRLIGRTSVSWSYNALLFVFFVTKDASPQTFCSPDARAQTLELHDLTMINEQVDVASVVLDIPCEYFRICCFEHQLVGAEFINQKRRHICAPRVCVFGDSL